MLLNSLRVCHACDEAPHKYTTFSALLDVETVHAGTAATVGSQLDDGTVRRGTVI
jgi:hypothetical protein